MQREHDHNRMMFNDASAAFDHGISAENVLERTWLSKIDQRNVLCWPPKGRIALAVCPLIGSHELVADEMVE
jgi:hypothetical protein